MQKYIEMALRSFVWKWRIDSRDLFIFIFFCDKKVVSQNKSMSCVLWSTKIERSRVSSKWFHFPFHFWPFHGSMTVASNCMNVERVSLVVNCNNQPCRTPRREERSTGGKITSTLGKRVTRNNDEQWSFFATENYHWHLWRLTRLLCFCISGLPERILRLTNIVSFRQVWYQPCHWYRRKFLKTMKKQNFKANLTQNLDQECCMGITTAFYGFDIKSVKIFLYFKRKNLFTHKL